MFSFFRMCTAGLAKHLPGRKGSWLPSSNLCTHTHTHTVHTRTCAHTHSHRPTHTQTHTLYITSVTFPCFPYLMRLLSSIFYSVILSSQNSVILSSYNSLSFSASFAPFRSVSVSLALSSAAALVTVLLFLLCWFLSLHPLPHAWWLRLAGPRVQRRAHCCRM